MGRERSSLRLSLTRSGDRDRKKRGGEPRSGDRDRKTIRRYRYYVSHSLIKRGRPKASDAARRVPAGDVERLVEARIIAFLTDGGALHGALEETTSQAHEIETLMAKASSLADRWYSMQANDKSRLLQGLVSRIALKPEGLEIGIRTAHLADILRSGEEIGPCEPSARSDQPILVLNIAARLKRTGIEKKLLIEAANKRSGTRADANLLKLIARAHELQAIFMRGGRPISEMAEEAGLSSSYFTRLLRLSFLAPDITRAILCGRAPANLTARRLMSDTRVAVDWNEPRAQINSD